MLEMIENTILYLNMITYATDIDVNNVPVKKHLQISCPNHELLHMQSKFSNNNY